MRAASILLVVIVFIGIVPAISTASNTDNIRITETIRYPQGDHLTYVVEVKNLGADPGFNIIVRFSFDGGHVHYEEIAVLYPGCSKQVSVRWLWAEFDDVPDWWCVKIELSTGASDIDCTDSLKPPPRKGVEINSNDVIATFLILLTFFSTSISKKYWNHGI